MYFKIKTSFLLKFENRKATLIKAIEILKMEAREQELEINEK